jgi:hypothetical protein
LIDLNDQCGHREGTQVAPVITRRNGAGALDDSFGGREKELIQNPLTHRRRNRRVFSQKQGKAPRQKRRSILLEARHEIIDHDSLCRDWFDGTNQNDTRDPVLPGARYISGTFTAAHRMTDERDVPKIKLLDDSPQG